MPQPSLATSSQKPTNLRQGNRWTCSLGYAEPFQLGRLAPLSLQKMLSGSRDGKLDMSSTETGTLQATVNLVLKVQNPAGFDAIRESEMRDSWKHEWLGRGIRDLGSSC